MNDLLKSCRAWSPVGSRHTCSPPPTNTDNDTLCWVEDARLFAEIAESHGFVAGHCGSDPSDNPNNAPFLSLRQGDENLIVTEDYVFYRRFVAATAVAKSLNLMAKQDRIDLFQAVLYGNSPEPTK